MRRSRIRASTRWWSARRSSARRSRSWRAASIRSNPGLISICQFHAGSADNVIPQTAILRGTARSLLPEVRDTLENRLRQIVEGTAKAYGAKATLTYNRHYPVTRNHAQQTEFAAAVAGEVVGRERVDADTPPLMGGEDFSFMLEARPGAFIFIGNGDSAGLHHPAYDFNDDVIPVGARSGRGWSRPRCRDEARLRALVHATSRNGGRSRSTASSGCAATCSGDGPHSSMCVTAKPARRSRAKYVAIVRCCLITPLASQSVVRGPSSR